MGLQFTDGRNIVQFNFPGLSFVICIIAGLDRTSLLNVHDNTLCPAICGDSF